MTIVIKVDSLADCPMPKCIFFTFFSVLNQFLCRPPLCTGEVTPSAPTPVCSWIVIPAAFYYENKPFFLKRCILLLSPSIIIIYPTTDQTAPDSSIINSHLEEGKTISLKERLQEFETALLGNHHYKKRYLNKSDQKKKSWPKRNLVIIYPTTVQTSACCRLFHN